MKTLLKFIQWFEQFKWETHLKVLDSFFHLESSEVRKVLGLTYFMQSRPTYHCVFILRALTQIHHALLTKRLCWPRSRGPS